MYKVEIDLKSGKTLKLAQISAGTEEPRLIDVSNITYSISRNRGSESNRASILCENETGFFTSLMLSGDRFIKGCPLRIYNEDLLIFSGQVAELPQPTDGSKFQIIADVKTGGYTRCIARKVTAGKYPLAPSENEGKYINIVAGTAEGAEGILTAIRVADNLYVAASHHIYSIDDVYLSDGTLITTSCSLYNNLSDGRAYINYSGPNESEIYFNCLGLFDRIYENNKLINGDLENWTGNIPEGWEIEQEGESTVNAEVTDVYQGLYSCRLDVDSLNSIVGIKQNLLLSSNEINTLRFWYKSSGTIEVLFKNTDGGLFLDESGNWQSESTTILLSPVEEYTLFEILFYSTENTTYRLRFRNDQAASSSIYIDQVGIFEELKELIENPAKALNSIIKMRGHISIDQPALEEAERIFESRGYTGISIIINDGTSWETFLQNWCRNFDAYRSTSLEMAFVPILLDWGGQTPEVKIDASEVILDSATWYPDIKEIHTNISRMFKYHFRKNYFLRRPEDIIAKGTQWPESSFSLDLRYHTDEATTIDVASRFLFFFSDAQVFYSFKLPPWLDKKVMPGAVVLLMDMRFGPYQYQDRLVLILRKTVSDGVRAMDITKINDGILRLKGPGDPDIARLQSDQQNKHRLL